MILLLKKNEKKLAAKRNNIFPRIGVQNMENMQKIIYHSYWKTMRAFMGELRPLVKQRLTKEILKRDYPKKNLCRRKP